MKYKISNKKQADAIELTPDTPVKSGFNWFPGHMARAFREIKEKVKFQKFAFRPKISPARIKNLKKRFYSYAP